MDNFSIEKVTENLTKEIKVDSDGKGWCSIRGAARLGDKSHQQLSYDLKSGGGLEPSKLAEFLISQGFEGVALTQWKDTGIPDTALACILEYWAIEGEDFTLLISEERLNGGALTNREDIRLTIDCFKMFGMMLGS